MSSNVNTEENILESVYKPVPVQTLTNTSVSNYLLKKAAENVENGIENWMTNVLTGETIKFAEIDAMTKNVSAVMSKKGMKKGDIALYLTTDVTRIYAIVLGVWRLGGCMYSSYPEDTEDTLRTRIEEANARWIFCDPVSVPQCLAAAKLVAWTVEVIVFGSSDGCTSVDELFKPVDTSAVVMVDDAEPDDPLLILCTSGTTGRSKGAIYTNKSILAFCVGTDGFPWNPKPFLYLLKCTHVLGVLFPLRNIAAASWSIMMHQISKEAIYKAVEQYKPFLAFGFPTYLMGIVTDPDAQKYDRSSLEIMCTGGIVIPPTVYETLMKLPSLKAVMNGFGMTECGAITTTVDLSYPNEYRVVPSMPAYSVGRLYPNTLLKILDLDTGKALGPNQKGEVTIKSPVMCSGYWNRPEENARTFCNGWLRSGDIGYYNEDGFLFISGRIKDTFKYFNNHISPDELEEVLLKHDAVAEASVFGIRDEGGDVPRAAVVLKSGFKVSPEEIQAFADGKLAAYKKIRGGVFIVPSLPRGNTGKVVRSMVASMPLTK